MNLYIDIGNTRTKFAVYDQGVFKPVEFTPELLESGQIDHIVVAEVGSHGELEVLTSRFNQLSLPYTELKTTKNAGGVENSYATPTNLGVDRWLTLVAAHSQFPKRSVLIIDAGTALTVDALSPEGKHLGGWIVPGFDLMVESIVSKAPKVFDGQVSISALEFGRDTPDCVNHGCLAAQLGVILLGATLLQKYKQNEPSIILLTGGGIKKIRDFIESLLDSTNNIEIVENRELVFEGMRVCFEQSR